MVTLYMCSSDTPGEVMILFRLGKSDMSRYGYLEVFQRVLGTRDNESRHDYLRVNL